MQQANRQGNSNLTFEDLSEGVLRDSKIAEIRIFEENYVLNITVTFRTPRNGIVSIRFEQVVEYYFSLNEPGGFHDVEDYRFIYLKEEDKYYITLDPDPESDSVSEKDTDFIKAKTFALM